MNSSALRKLYDRLAGFESRDPSKTLYPVHKRLDFTDQSNGENPDDLFDYLLEFIQLNPSSKILDLGCGVGYGLLMLAREFNCKGLGISISPKEIDLARGNAQRLGLQDQCRFELRDFNQAIPGDYDLIIAVESLKHAKTLERTLPQIMENLTHGGQLIIVDDFWQNDSRMSDKNLEIYQEYWQLWKVYTLKDFLDLISVDVKCKVSETDLSSFVIKRNPIKLQCMHELFKIAARLPINSISSLSKIYLGGTALEKLYQQQKMKYKMILIEKV